MSLKATIRYRDNNGIGCTRTEDFVVPIGGGRLGIYKDDNMYNKVHEIINMAAPTFISVKWCDPMIDNEYRDDVSYYEEHTHKIELSAVIDERGTW